MTTPPKGISSPIPLGGKREFLPNQGQQYYLPNLSLFLHSLPFWQTELTQAGNRAKDQSSPMVRP